ncbi:MAG TPA: DNA mismatch repair protein MutS [Hyphomicrobiaceae bacterium]|nr:DNA mismatch repair protein MutS [Hyphomicrobiaceae bacterium]
MAQFLEIKATHPDCLLFYRMGDFYELFFEDAVAAAAALGIVLTKRGKHLGADIPMCGVPIHRAEEYLHRLIKQGFRVAVCEQLEDPAEARRRGSKAVVRRDVVRLVTPGTLTEDSLLDARARNYLTAIFYPPPGAGAKRVIALASLEISTGECEMGEVSTADFAGDIMRLSPSEVIVSEQTLTASELRRGLDSVAAAVTPVPGASFDSLAGERLLKERLGVADLAAFGAFTRAELAATGALLKYVELTQLGQKVPLRPPRRTGPDDRLLIDAATRSSIELLRSLSGSRQGSLLGAIDRTLTGPGARELASRLAGPLRDPTAIAARLDAVAFLNERDGLREDLRRGLRSAPDIARALARLALQRGGPRDLAAVRDGLGTAGGCAELLRAACGAVGLPVNLAATVSALSACSTGLARQLGLALADELPQHRRDGGFVRQGFRAELDAARGLRDDNRQMLAELEAKYVAETGVKSLRVRHNNILGFYLEAPAGSAKPLLSEPLAQRFKHRQTMAGAVRFTTEELIETQSLIVAAADRALALEQEIFAELLAAIKREHEPLIRLAAALAELDCEAGLAEVAAEQGYARPTLDDSTTFDIRGGRHPVVEQALTAAQAGQFICNDCVLVPATAAAPDGFAGPPKARLWLVTGPNMAGKSTFLRQNALITVMAQMGSFVPARSATIGIVDRLFSRVGAADDLARGRSTFMVEMVETAAILNQASERSLVILDEIGRGTATFDGLSIAWAVVEFLQAVNKCRGLFATHYHELTVLAGRLDEIANVTMDVKEWRDEIIFLHQVRPGAADRSYGIQVATLAGLPKPVTERAAQVLALLENSEAKAGNGEALLNDLPLFAAARSKACGRPEATALERALADVNPDELTPKSALDALYKLKALVEKGRP